MGCLHPPGRSAGKGDAPTVGRAVLTPHPDPGSTPREAALDTRTDPACTVLGRAHPTEAVPRECDSPEAKPALKPAVQRPFPGVTRQLPGAAPETLLPCPALPSGSTVGRKPPSPVPSPALHVSSRPKQAAPRSCAPRRRGIYFVSEGARGLAGSPADTVTHTDITSSQAGPNLQVKCRQPRVCGGSSLLALTGTHCPTAGPWRWTPSLQTPWCPQHRRDLQVHTATQFSRRGALCFLLLLYYYYKCYYYYYFE